ncbi:M56 family metallopeptidase [Hymenobacter ruricola]|uniref:M48 family metalloprotease n=1 Tax=Hymenobacter ruricola TaxID=2791023 RepID=A0ABS0HZ38_9BACT|nr:M56 family metallopeptidase [Hymenobacter ruricola]MBF9219950.1 M48 family metalloprotease [Hymenobacter ruricola]
MTALENFASPALTRALGWTLLHSLWQGALVAAVLAGALLLLRRQRAEVRYVASAGALGMMVALAGITFGLYFRAGGGPAKSEVLTTRIVESARTVPSKQGERPALRPATTTETVTTVVVSAADKASAGAEAPVLTAQNQADASAMPNWLAVGLRYFDKHMPLLVLGWLLGLLAMSLRMLGGLLYVQRLRRYRVRPLGAVWQERLAALAARSGVRRPVALLESALVQVPLVVGHVRPVILLPLGAVAGLSAAHLEAILAHELAHVLRRDYLVNLLQTVAESLFFYHPAVWFMARCVRTERENCCDDTATALCGGDSLRLARALTALAEWSQSAVVTTSPRLALAAMGGRGALLNRVRRLVQRRPAAPTLAEGCMAGALVLGGLGLLGGSVALAGPLSRPAAASAQPAAFDWQTGPVQNAARPTAPADTTKRAAAAKSGAAATPAAGTAATEAAAAKARELAAADEDTHGSDATMGDTIFRRNVRERRDGRRVIVDGREAAPVLAGPGTVVVTKDKKGRITDLVVNGQRVETATGKVKAKSKNDKDAQVEVIQVDPASGPQSRTYVYGGNSNGNAPYVYQWPQANGGTYVELGPLAASPQGLNELRRLAPRSNGRTFVEVAPGNFNQLWNRNSSGNFTQTFRSQLPGGPAGPDPSLAQTRDALRAAERGLREASAVKNLSAEQRKRLNSRLDEVRAQLKRLDSAPHSLRFGDQSASSFRSIESQGLQEELRAQEEELRARQQELRDRQQELRDRAAEMGERLREEREEQREERSRVAERRSVNEEVLVSELLKDGLIKDRNNFQFRLTARELVVDGKTQPQKVLDKYVKLYEKNSGRKMTATSSVSVGRNGTSTTISDHDAAPPRLPRPPRAPMPPAPMGPSGALAPPPPAPLLDAPAPPRPPRAPSVDTRALRDELRKDGLVGENDKSFSLQLNSSGLTVNGKKVSDDQAAKYRKLLDAREGSTYNMSISLD